MKRSLLVCFLLFFASATVLAGADLEEKKKGDVFWMEHKCKMESTEVTKDEETIEFEPVMCVCRVRVSKFPTVMDRYIAQVACTKGERPWVMAYVETNPSTTIPVKAVFLDLENKAWLFSWREFGPETMEVVKRVVKEQPDLRPSMLEAILFDEKVSFGIYHMETDILEFPSIDLGLKKPKATGERLKQWVRDVVDLFEEQQPDLLNTLRVVSDSLISAENSEGRYCCRMTVGTLSPAPEFFLPMEAEMIRGGGLKVVRDCEEELAVHYENKEEWPEFWENFSKWDTWPDFPNIKRLRF